MTGVAAAAGTDGLKEESVNTVAQLTWVETSTDEHISNSQQSAGNSFVQYTMIELVRQKHLRDLIWTT